MSLKYWNRLVHSIHWGSWALLSFILKTSEQDYVSLLCPFLNTIMANTHKKINSTQSRFDKESQKSHKNRMIEYTGKIHKTVSDVKELRKETGFKVIKE